MNCLLFRIVFQRFFRLKRNSCFCVWDFLLLLACVFVQFLYWSCTESERYRLILFVMSWGLKRNININLLLIWILTESSAFVGAAIFVWCENARTNDGENPEITIPKSEFGSMKSEVWRYLSLSVRMWYLFKEINILGT
jgi:hypothetical protein